MSKDKPIIVTLKIESTNFNTQRYALEALVNRMKAAEHSALLEGAVIEDKYWKLTVVERQNLLDDEPKDKP